MKSILLLFTAAFLVSTASAQIKLVPLTIAGPKPADATKYLKKPIKEWVGANGHWEPLDKNNKEAALAGFSFSDIYCTKQHKTCVETSASVIPNVGLQVVTDHNEYDIIKWDEEGLTARYVGGSCKIAHTLEIDFKTGSVILTDAPTKVDPEMAFCPKSSFSYQLMEGDAFTVVEPKGKD